MASGAARDHREVLALARDACLGDAPGDRVGREADIEAFMRYAVETLAGARR